MNTTPYSQIILSFIVALLLTIIPLPEALEWYRPLWLPMASLYWSIALPYQVSLVVVWLFGLLQDIAIGTILGQTAFALILVVFIANKLALQIRTVPMFQQCVYLIILLSLYLLLNFWVVGITGKLPMTWAYWSPVLTSTLLWPIVISVLNKLRRTSRIV